VGPILGLTETGGVSEMPKSNSLQRQEHLPMLSLENAMNEEQVIAWLKRVRKILNQSKKKSCSNDENDKLWINVTPKLDGLSLTLRYRQIISEDICKDPREKMYSLEWAATRGNGKIGEDVTDAAMAMKKSIPLTICLPVDGIDQLNSSEVAHFFEIRGEVILPRKEFLKYNNCNAESTDENRFSNPRNAASGILRRTKNLSEATSKLRSALNFVAYDVISSDGSKVLGGTALSAQNCLGDLGFLTPLPTLQTRVSIYGDNRDCNEFEPLFNFYRSLVSSRDTLDFDIDGAVYKLDSFEHRLQCGSSSRTPRWAIAHKFAAKSAVTRLLGIDVQIGRTGSITPVAILEPVNISDVVVSRATLHNFSYANKILANGKGHIRKGTAVVVARAGDVIPQVLNTVGNSEISKDENRSNEHDDLIFLTHPTNCPACGSSTVFETISKDSKSEKTGQVLRCSGSVFDCEPRAIAALSHSFSRDAIDVRGLSESKIKQLKHAGVLKEPYDLFLICDDFSLQTEIKQLPGWGVKSVENLVKSISMVKQRGVELDRFIFALGIRHCGIESSRLLASFYRTGDSFLSCLNEFRCGDKGNFDRLAGTDEQEGIKGIGPILKTSLLSFFSDKQLLDSTLKLASVLPIADYNINTIASSENKFAGKSIVFTGSLPGVSRSEAQKVMRDLGALSTPSTVSRNTDLVIEGIGGGKKVEKAKDLGIEIMSKDDWFSIIETLS